MLQSKSIKQPKRASLSRLFFSHVDAWGVTLIISSTALALHDQLSLKTAYLLFGLTAGYWLAFALNDYFDAPDDAKNKIKSQRNFFVLHQFTLLQKVIISSILALVIGPAFWQFGMRGILVTLISGFVMWGYSAPPLRFKSRPGIDLLSHTLFVETFPYWVCLVLTGVTWQSFDYMLLALAATTSFSAQLEQQARDYETDKLTETTFTTAVGLRINQWLLLGATILLCSLTVIAFVTQILPLYLLPIALCALPVGLRRFTKRDWGPNAQRLSYIMAMLAAVYVVGLLGWMIVF